MEVSEREQARRKEAKRNEVGAQSFRLGHEHLTRLKKLAQREDVSQAQKLRDLIDGDWDRVQQARKRR